MPLHGVVLLLLKDGYFSLSKLSASFRAHLARSQAPSAGFLLINTRARFFLKILICFLCRISDTFLPVAAGFFLPAKLRYLDTKKCTNPPKPTQTVLPADDQENT